MTLPPLSPSPADHNVFAGNPLNRAANERKDQDWLQAQYDDPQRRLLALWRLRAPVQRRCAAALAWAPPGLADHPSLQAQPVLLGLLDNVPHFAIDTSAVDDPLAALPLPPDTEFLDARAVAPDLPPAEAGLLAQARALVDWHARHGYCPACGAATAPRQGGASRVCTSCDAQHFPRTDPVVITLVHDGGDRCLLAARAGPRPATAGRPGEQDPPRFTCVAGFVDQGETIEEAVRREVLEEVGVRVGEVSYHHSQPWPFPSSLMIGCWARAESTEITVDGDEIGQAYWFTREQARRATSPGDDSGPAPTSAGVPPLHVPPPIAIAHHLIKAWANA